MDTAKPPGGRRPAITPDHLQFLAEHAITPETIERIGIYSITTKEDLPEAFTSYGDHAVPALAFPWQTSTGATFVQLRPDTPIEVVGESRPRKYLWPAGQTSAIAVVREDSSGPVIFVEGTKQSLAAASYVDSGSVYGIAGCRSWSAEGVPLDLDFVLKREVIVIFDADLSTNPDVHAAATKFRDALKADGAAKIQYVILPAGKTAGLDDVLGSKPADRRAAYLARLIEQAREKLPAKPKKPPGGWAPNPYIDPAGGGLQTKKLAAAVFATTPLLLTQEDRVAVYRDGVYRTDGTALFSVVGELLDEQYRRQHRATVEEFVVGRLARDGMRTPMHADGALLNVANGMLDLATGTLKPHDPEYRSTVQLPVPWDPDAQCPVYTAWVEEVAGTQVDDLEEVTSLMLDPSRTPPKAVFLFGPSRSGKSTYLRLMLAMAGAGNASAVTLHQLADDRFAAANVYGKILNAAADLSAAQVKDMSIFKMMSGEDAIQANRKYGAQFTFMNRALFAFSANELPTVSESSTAYFERIKPFHFDRSYAGREDPTIEDRMRDELAGILARWVRAWQRRHVRGAFLPTDPRVQHTFEVASDRVRAWVDDELEVIRELDGAPLAPGTNLPVGAGTAPRELARMFNAWADAQQGSRLGERKIISRLTCIDGVLECRLLPGRGRALNMIKRQSGGQGTASGGQGTASGGQGTASGDPFGVGMPEMPGGQFHTLTGSSTVDGQGPNTGVDQGRIERAETTVPADGPEIDAVVSSLNVEQNRPETALTAHGSNDQENVQVNPGQVVSSTESETAREHEPAGQPPDAHTESDSTMDGQREIKMHASGIVMSPLAFQPPAVPLSGWEDPERSPIEHLTPYAVLPLVPQCPDCDGPKSLVPPALFWFACPACCPDTFHRA